MSIHVRKDSRSSQVFLTASDGKLGGAWVQGYLQMGPEQEIKSLNDPFISMMMIDQRLAVKDTCS